MPTTSAKPRTGTAAASTRARPASPCRGPEPGSGLLVGHEEALEVAVLDVGLDAEHPVALRGEGLVRAGQVVGRALVAEAPGRADPDRHRLRVLARGLRGRLFRRF